LFALTLKLHASDFGCTKNGGDSIGCAIQFMIFLALSYFSSQFPLTFWHKTKFADCRDRDLCLSSLHRVIFHVVSVLLQNLSRAVRFRARAAAAERRAWRV
jgi:hypothetical protein